MSSSKNLTNAKNNKKDEFYTQYTDIENEISRCLKYDSNIFRDKVILLPCDDPALSNFTRYFVKNFKKLGIKKLISTCIGNNKQPYGRKMIMTNDGERLEYMECDGDFRSEEVTKLRNMADIIITNPPFSLFREFLAWIVESGKKFLIVGSINAVTYKNVFPLIQNGKMWISNGFGGMVGWFHSPYEDYAVANERYEGKIRVSGVCWFTNLAHYNTPSLLNSKTMAENIKLSKKPLYETYDDYNAINVPYTKYIPSDYNGVMGVPITFLTKYNPNQFEILGLCKYMQDNPHYGQTFSLNGKKLYARVIIRNKEYIK